MVAFYLDIAGIAYYHCFEVIIGANMNEFRYARDLWILEV